VDITHRTQGSVNPLILLTARKHGSPAPPAEAGDGLFGAGRRFLDDHLLLTDGLIVAGLFVVATAWLADSQFAGPTAALVQVALILPLGWRRSRSTFVFMVIAFVALLQWIFGHLLIGDVALLAGLYSVAVHESRVRTLGATAILEIGAILAATRWHPAGTVPRSLAFLTATVVAALCAGLTVRSGSQYLGWLAERASRLELERDQQASLAAAEERTRIAREMHDIVAHSLSVVVTLADAASMVNRSDPERAAEAMRQASAVGRQALGDMRAMIGVLRTESAETADLVPQPGLAELGALVDRVRATGLDVVLDQAGSSFPLGPSAELSIYRIVQESLTNTIKHASAQRARVTLCYEQPLVTVQVADDGTGKPLADTDAHGKPEPSGQAGPFGNDSAGGGHGIDGMRERAALHGGSLVAGPTIDGGWAVTSTLHSDAQGAMP
jgi:signal transduction histidine kinase